MSDESQTDSSQYNGPESYPGFIQLTYRGAELLANIVLLFYVALLISQVVLRYGFNSSIFWSEELIRFGLVWNLMLGSALVSLREEHIRVDIFENLFRRRAREVVRIFIQCVCFVFWAMLLYYGAEFLLHTANQRSTVTHAPMTIAYGSVAVGGFLMVLFTAAAILRRIAAFVGDSD